MAALLSVYSAPADARMTSAEEILEKGFTPIHFVSPANVKASFIENARKKQLIEHYCEALKIYFARYKWSDDPCGKVEWRAELKSKNGHPLVYAVFGDGEENTLLLSGVHPDELTPIPIAFEFAKHLTQHPELYQGQGIRVVVAPLVNPDGFLRNVPSRGNANAVDVNRNFYTMDWYAKALSLWQQRRKREIRHFPGYFPNTEIETIFQVKLIDDFKPDKILSIHAPLGFLDYDGPGDGQPRVETPTEKRAKRFVHSISEKSQNYRVVDYSFYPGSLGNYAGNERHIPTVTLELETTDPKMVDAYWKQFLPGMLQSIHYPFKTQGAVETGANATRFSSDYEDETI